MLGLYAFASDCQDCQDAAGLRFVRLAVNVLKFRVFYLLFSLCVCGCVRETSVFQLISHCERLNVDLLVQQWRHYFFSFNFCVIVTKMCFCCLTMRRYLFLIEFAFATIALTISAALCSEIIMHEIQTTNTEKT